MPMQVMKVIKVMTRMIANHDDDDGDDDGLLAHSARDARTYIYIYAHMLALAGSWRCTCPVKTAFCKLGCLS